MLFVHCVHLCTPPHTSSLRIPTPIQISRVYLHDSQWVWGGLSWTCLLSYWVLSYFIWSSKSFICEETKSFRIFSFFCNHSKYVTPMSTDCGAHLRPATCTDMLENSSVLYILWLEDAHSSVRREANGIELVHPTLICGIKNIYRILKWFVFFTSHVNLHPHFTKE